MSESASNKLCLILSSFPDQSSAKQLAEYLVKNHLAACVNLLAPCTSIYQWQNKLHQDQELPIIIKTRVCLYKDVEQAILAHHPYELPEIISVPIDYGYSQYIEWLVGKTTILPT